MFSMKVRVPNLLGKDVHEASFVQMDDELSDDGGKKWVLQVRPQGGDNLHMESYSSDEIVLVEATDGERQELADRGFTDIQTEA